jgi:predicted aldo/keto reductase-like oxidoreductase
MAYNRTAMFDDMDRSRFVYRRRIPDLEKADQCIQCDECLPKCPQNIPISSWMPVIADVLGGEKPFVDAV